MTTIRIGTRGSALAQAQTAIVEELLKERWPEAVCERVLLRTKGDRYAGRPLSELGGKGVFVSELERALQEGRIDLAVHSAKDLPGRLGEGLCVLAVPKRGDARDVLVSCLQADGSGAAALSELSPGMVVGTGSARREWYLRQAAPRVVCRGIRGNVDTRISKVGNGYDAVILAKAGLDRLGIAMGEDRGKKITPIPVTVCLPAACQGLLAVEGRADWIYRDRLTSISDPESLLAYEVEREVLRLLGADCREPAAAYCRIEAHALRLSVMHAGEQREATLSLSDWRGQAAAVCEGL